MNIVNVMSAATYNKFKIEGKIFEPEAYTAGFHNGKLAFIMPTKRLPLEPGEVVEMPIEEAQQLKMGKK